LVRDGLFMSLCLLQSLCTFWHYRISRDDWVLVVVAILHPSQGFMNSLIYMRRNNIKTECKDLFLVKRAKRVGAWVTKFNILTRSGLDDSTQKGPLKTIHHSGDTESFKAMRGRMECCRMMKTCLVGRKGGQLWK